MKQTISILLSNRFNDAERIIGLFSATGYKIEKMFMTDEANNNLSRLIIVTDVKDKNVNNFLMRLRQQVRVSAVEAVEGDELLSEQAKFSV